MAAAGPRRRGAPVLLCARGAVRPWRSPRRRPRGPPGTPIRSACSGVVVHAGPVAGHGARGERALRRPARELPAAGHGGGPCRRAGSRRRADRDGRRGPWRAARRRPARGRPLRLRGPARAAARAPRVRQIPSRSPRRAARRRARCDARSPHRASRRSGPSQRGATPALIPSPPGPCGPAWRCSSRARRAPGASPCGGDAPGREPRHARPRCPTAGRRHEPVETRTRPPSVRRAAPCAAERPTASLSHPTWPSTSRRPSTT